MDKLIEKLSEIKPDIDFTVEDSLIDNALLSSFDIISIVTMLEKEYEVKIPASKLRASNFNNVAAIYKMLQELMEED